MRIARDGISTGGDAAARDVEHGQHLDRHHEKRLGETSELLQRRIALAELPQRLEVKLAAPGVGFVWTGANEIREGLSLFRMIGQPIARPGRRDRAEILFIRSKGAAKRRRKIVQRPNRRATIGRIRRREGHGDGNEYEDREPDARTHRNSL